MKRLVCIMLSFCVIFSVFAGIGFTASAETEGVYAYSIEDGGVKITDVDSSVSGDVEIPSTLGGYPVTEIGYRAFDNCKDNITSVTIPSGITNIDYGAFMYCSKLVSINIDENNQNYLSLDGVLFNKPATELIKYPQAKQDSSYIVANGVETICDDAFQDCTALQTVVIPNSVTIIESDAFDGCTSLSNVTLGSGLKEIGGWAFRDCVSLEQIKLPSGLEKIGFASFSDCTALQVIDVPNSVTTIGSCAFEDCTALASIKIGSGVSKIDNFAFRGCTSLVSFSVDESNVSFCSKNDVLFNKDITELIHYPARKSGTDYTVPSTVTTLAMAAFYRCAVLENVILPDKVTVIPGNAFTESPSIKRIKLGNNVTTIGDWVFSNCTALKSIVIPDSVTSVGQAAFSGCKSLESAVIGKGLTSVGYWMFRECHSLKNVTIPSSVTSIGASAFANCSSLENITIPNSVTTIADNAFMGCDSLKSIIIPNSVTSLGSYAFAYCDSLASITLSDGLTIIGDYTFNECNALESIVIPNNITSIGEGAFSYSIALESVTIGSGVTSIGNEAFFNCQALTEINVAKNNEHYSSQDGVLFNKDATELLQYPMAKEDTFYNVPNGVEKIADRAFYACEKLTSVTLPNTVTSIGEWAIAFCWELTSINIGNNVESIGDFAFACCNKLANIKLPESVTSIGGSAFHQCDDLTFYVYDGSYAQMYAWNNYFYCVTLRKAESGGVSVEMPLAVLSPDTNFSVTAVNLESIEVKLPEGAEVSSALIYDIYFEKDGEKVQPNGDVTVSIPVPESMNGKNCVVYFIDENGNLTDMNAVFENGCMVFTTNHFSLYSVMELEPEGVLGDANGDGVTNINDAVVISKVAAKLETLDENEAKFSDVNGDGSINVGDAVLIARYSAKLLDKFPAEQ